MEIVKHQKSKTAQQLHDEKVLAYWLMFLQAPGNSKPNLDGSFSLGEIGETKSDRGIERWCPYAPATGLK